MSDATKLAEAEAQRAEAENPDEPETSDASEPGDGEPEPQGAPAEPEPDEGALPASEAEQDAISEKEMERVLKALDKEAVRHGERVRDLMGSDFETLAPCPMCVPNIPGFRFQVMPSPVQLAQIKDAIGEPLTPDYANDNYSSMCRDCQGLGLTLTGSKVPGQGTVQCYSCKGTGWTAVGPERAQAQGATVTALPAPADPSQSSAETPLSPEAEAARAQGYIVVPMAPPPPAVVSS